MKYKLAKAMFMGTMGLVVLSSLSGCGSDEQEQAQSLSNKLITVEQLANGRYVIVQEEDISGPTKAIIRERDANGTLHERVMSEAEMRDLAAQEYAKFEQGGSELNSDPQGEGMGLGSTLLAVAGGALLGNMVANALMSNSHVQRHHQYSNHSAYYRDHKNRNYYGSNGGYAGSSNSKSSKSFFGGSSSNSHHSSSFFGG